MVLGLHRRCIKGNKLAGANTGSEVDFPFFSRVPNPTFVPTQRPRRTRCDRVAIKVVNVGVIGARAEG